MDELVIVGEGQGFPAIDGDFAGAEGAALLDDGMGVIGEASAAQPAGGQEGDQTFMRHTALSAHGTADHFRPPGG